MTYALRLSRARSLVEELISLVGPALSAAPALPHDSISVAKAEIEKVRTRHILAGRDLDESCWSMMLDLHIAAFERRGVSVSSLCIAAMCPDTTALRKLCQLEQQGLIFRSDDPSDQRRTFMALTSMGRVIVSQYLERVAQMHSTTSTSSSGS